MADGDPGEGGELRPPLLREVRRQSERRSKRLRNCRSKKCSFILTPFVRERDAGKELWMANSSHQGSFFLGRDPCYGEKGTW